MPAEAPEAQEQQANGRLEDHEQGVSSRAEEVVGSVFKKLTAAQKRRQRKKASKANKKAARVPGVLKEEAASESSNNQNVVEVEYVSAPREYEDLLQPSTQGGDADASGQGSTAGLGAGSSSGFASAGFVSASEPDTTTGDETPGLGSQTGLGGLGLGATPQRGSEWDEGALGLGSTGGLGLGATPGPGDTPSNGAGGGLKFTRGSDLGKPADVKSTLADFERIFSKFASAEEVTGAKVAEEDEDANQEAEEAAPAAAQEPKQEAEDSDSDDEKDKGDGLSKKKRKLESRLKIAELKQACPRPEVVEVWDVTAQDPKLLVYLKAYRNSVPVPRHWSQKRKYLQGKRGIEKPPFVLPSFIEATGISEMRQAYQEKEENKKLKSKQREKMQPKMGKLDIDYQVLHDAFFKFQSKPHLTVMGDLYYEGKEFEARIKGSKPGILSEDLRVALGMGDNSPPPWLINMQRYGPPPSYPDLKIAGLNAPIPPGAQFGYHPGGWGKPPVDETGEPLYGDVFGQNIEESDDEQVDKSVHWGDLESEEEESSEEEEEEEEEEADNESLADGLTSVVSGYSSLPSGIETPEVLNLRKGTAAAAPAGDQRPLYQVLEQQAANVGQGIIMGSDHTYVMPTAGDATGRRPANVKKLEQLRKEQGTDLEVTIDPEELEGLDQGAVRALYEQRLAEERARHSREDFSDMVAQKAAQQKRKAAQQKEAGKNKRQKDSFQF